MFNNLTKNFSGIFDKLFKGGLLTEEQIDLAMREVRIALLEADVALPVAKAFIAQVKEKAIGQEVIKAISPRQMVIKIIHDELVSVLGGNSTDQTAMETKFLEKKHDLILKDNPAVIMTVGLQAGGKTTSAAKIANLLKFQNKKVLLVSLDIYRPAAQKQLEILAKSVGVDSLEIIEHENPLVICKRALLQAKNYDVIIFDTAGRLHIDQEMIEELKQVKALIQPSEIMLVADGLTGQDAINIAQHFDKEVNITGITLTRMDADARGGAALSMRYITGKPIKFLGVGEKLTDLEIFDPERIASRILDMGDVVALVEKAANAVDQAEAQKMAARMQKGIFTLVDYAGYLRQIKKLGSLKGILGMLPGMSGLMDRVDRAKLDDKVFDRQVAIISSMTPKEKRNPDILNFSRKTRIAKGSGTTIQDVNRLLKQFREISTMMKRMSGLDPSKLANGGERGLMSKLFGKR